LGGGQWSGWSKRSKGVHWGRGVLLGCVAVLIHLDLGVDHPVEDEAGQEPHGARQDEEHVGEDPHVAEEQEDADELLHPEGGGEEVEDGVEEQVEARGAGRQEGPPPPVVVL